MLLSERLYKLITGWRIEYSTQEQILMFSLHYSRKENTVPRWAISRHWVRRLPTGESRKCVTIVVCWNVCEFFTLFVIVSNIFTRNLIPCGLRYVLCSRVRILQQENLCANSSSLHLKMTSIQISGAAKRRGLRGAGTFSGWS